MLLTDSQKWLVLGCLALTGFLIYLLAPILMPFLVAALLAYMGDPLVDCLERYKISRTLSVLIVFGTIIIGCLLLLFVILPLVEKQITQLLNRVPAAIQWLITWAGPWFGGKITSELQPQRLTELAKGLAGHWDQAGDLLNWALTSMSRSGMALLAWLVNILLIPVVGFYLLRDWDLLIAKIHQLIPRQFEPLCVKLTLQCNTVLGAFIRGQLIVMLVLAIIYAVGLWWVGLDLALLIGFIAGLASIVPYLGFICGLLTASIAAITQLQDFYVLIPVVLVFAVGQIIEAMVLTPWLVGDKIGLHPVAVIFAILAGGQLFGFIGVLLALPMAAVIMVLARHASSQYLVSDFYQSPALPPEKIE